MLASAFEKQNCYTIFKMKKFFICGLLFTLFVYFVNGSSGEERRLREGNSFSRKLRACNLICSVKGSRASYNQTRCYRIPSQNVVATDCVFKCLRRKLGNVLLLLLFLFIKYTRTRCNRIRNIMFHKRRFDSHLR